MKPCSLLSWRSESPVIAGRKGSLATEVFLSGKGTLSICGVTQFKELQSEDTQVSNSHHMLEASIRHNMSDLCLSVTVSFSGEPGPSVHHHSCRGRRPICATVSLLTSPRAPLSGWSELRKNLKTRVTTQMSLFQNVSRVNDLKSVELICTDC